MNPDINAPVAAAQAQKAATPGFLQGQDTQTQGYLGKLSGYVNSQPSTSDLASRIGAELGLPALQSNANSLNQNLLNLPSTYSKATTGFDVNANQLARVVGTKQAELAPLAQAATTQAQTAQGNVNQRLGYAQQDFQNGLIPLTTEGNMLNDKLARETTLYSQDNQNELNTLIAKMQSGVTLSEGEKNRAQELAISEKNYQLQKDQLAEDSRQFNVTEANKPVASVEDPTTNAISTMMNYAQGDKSKMWAWIHQWEPEFGKQGVDANRLWALVNTT